jgi:hypothetical protein
MAMAPTTEQPQRIDLGQRFFLLSIFAVLVVEALATVVNMGHAFAWSSTILGIVSTLAILYLGNWLWTGDRTALTVTRIWALLQLALVVVLMVILLGDVHTGSSLPRNLNISTAWEGWLKLAAYIGLVVALFVPGVVLDFIASHRGEPTAPVAANAADKILPTGEPVNLAVEHVNALEGLSRAMKTVTGVLIVVGVFEVLAGLLTYGKTPIGSWLSVAEGVALVVLGALLLAPLHGLQSLLSAAPRNTGHVLTFLTQLSMTFTGYVVVFLALAAVVVCRFLF